MTAAAIKAKTISITPAGGEDVVRTHGRGSCAWCPSWCPFCSSAKSPRLLNGVAVIELRPWSVMVKANKRDLDAATPTAVRIAQRIFGRHLPEHAEDLRGR